MGFSKMIFLIVMGFILCLACPATVLASENVATGKAYILSPAPNYLLCMDDEDTTQLTDGKFSTLLWSDKNTVGWLYLKEIPSITIDLERMCAIERVDLHTMAGRGGGFELPAYAVVLVSRDGLNFQVAGYAAISEEIKIAGQQKKWFSFMHRIPTVKAFGRYVKILVQMETVAFFSDEITVIGTTSDDGSETSLPISINTNFSYNTIKAIEERLELIESITETSRVIAAQKEAFTPEQFEGWRNDLHDMTTFYTESRLPLVSQQNLEEAYKKIGRIRAEAYRAIYREPFVVIPADPMQVLSKREMIIPPRSLETKRSWLLSIRRMISFLFPSSPDVTVSLWQRESESLAFNIINCSPEPLTLNAHASLSTKTAFDIPTEKLFTLRRAEYVYALKAGLIADALLSLDDKPFEIAPGQVVQVWVTVNSRELTAGRYSAFFMFEAFAETKQLSKKKISVQLQVQPRVMPDHMALSTYNWAYPALTEITRKNALETSIDLQAHHINVFIVHPTSLPFPKNIKALGRPTPRESYTAMDVQIKSNRYAQMYLLFMGFTEMQRDSGRFGEWMSGSWKMNFKSWLVQLVKHLKNEGLGYDSFALYPYDEYSGDDFYKVARLIKETDPRIKIFVNSYGKGPQEFMRIRSLVDIWCVHQVESSRHPDWLETVQSFGKGVWVYKADGPVRFKNPFVHYRIMPWWAFKNGLTGAGFWVYSDITSTSWHDYGQCMGYYGVVYGFANAPVDTHGEKIIPSRRWEAWREGVEDYQYLTILQGLIDRMQLISPEKADMARQRLDRLVDAVLTGEGGQLMQVRQEVNGMILALDKEVK